jgi:hypothetical protein
MSKIQSSCFEGIQFRSLLSKATNSQEDVLMKGVLGNRDELSDQQKYSRRMLQVPHPENQQQIPSLLEAGVSSL